MDTSLALSKSEPAAAEAVTPTLADRLNALTATYGGRWTRARLAGVDTVRLHLDAGDVLAGSGATTALAVAALEAKVAKVLAAAG